MKRLARFFAGLTRHPYTRELFGIDVRALAVYRVALGVLLLLDLANRTRFLSAHYTDDGLVSRTLMIPRMKTWTLSLYWMNGTAGFAAAMFLIAALFALLLLVGYRTRLATIVSWVLLVSLQYRNPLVCHAGDHVLRLLLFWGMFLPLGICGSVDSRLAADRNVELGPRAVLSLGSLGLLLQVASIYFFAALLKSSPVWYREGTALYYALSLDRLSTPAGRWLLNFPELCRWLSLGTVGLELFAPALAFFPIGTRYLRTVVVLLMFGFHLGMAVTMNLILFPYICMTAWLVFLPSGFWERMSQRRPVSAVVDGWQSVVDRLAGWLSPAGETGGFWGWKPAGYREHIGTNVLAGVFVLYVFGCNLHSVTKNEETPPLEWTADRLRLNETAREAVEGIGSLLGISQGWIMFAPRPPRENGWWVVAAELADGRRVDLYRGGRALSWDKPVSIASEFGSHRWRKYMMSIWSKNRRYHAPHYARWLRENWNAEHDEGDRITSLEMYFMLEYTRPPGTPPVSAKLLVYRWRKSGSDRLISYSENQTEYKRLLEEAEE